MGVGHRILTPVQAAKQAGITVRELAALTAGDEGPAYIVMGPRVIRYLEADITAWVNSRDAATAVETTTPPETDHS